ncbi:MAG TPA: hypothetical protein VL201_04780 [Patescibacteria group bacterium]|jgi:hypothetical protein|nr:hypothetical protein [Patescibacteria group bacterium]
MILFLFLYAVANIQILYASYLLPDLCQRVLNNPGDVLLSNKKHRNNVYNQRTKCLVSYIKKIYDIELYNPVFLLGECKKEGCLLDRTLNSEYRKIFQEHFVKAVLPKVKKSLSLYWLSFASGGLFQDLCTACGLLAQYPTLNLSLDLVDLEFEPLVRFLRVTNQGREFDLDKCSKILESAITADAPIFEKCVNVGRPKHSDRSINNVDLRTSMMVQIWDNYLILRQFDLFFKRYFLSAKVSIHLYDTVDSYIDNIEKQNILPDIVTAVGIASCSSEKNIDNYQKLCFEILYNNPKIPNICLDTINGVTCLLNATLREEDTLLFNKEFIS